MPFDAVHRRIADELIEEALALHAEIGWHRRVRAVRWHARGDVRLDEVPVPTPGDTEVLLRIEAAAICGTDVDEVRLGPITVPVRPHPVNGRTAPMTLGHEMVGVVVEAGRGLRGGRRRAGRAVAVPAHAAQLPRLHHRPREPLPAAWSRSA